MIKIIKQKFLQLIKKLCNKNMNLYIIDSERRINESYDKLELYKLKYFNSQQLIRKERISRKDSFAYVRDYIDNIYLPTKETEDKSTYKFKLIELVDEEIYKEIE